MSALKIQAKFNKWVELTFSNEPPKDNIIAYYFAAYPTNRRKMAVVLFGNSKICLDQDSWFVSIPYKPKKAFTLGDWINIENPDDLLRELTRNYMTTDKYKDCYLDKAKSIVIGTIPGELEIIK